MHSRHFSMLREELRHFHGVPGMRTNSPRQGAHSAQDQPTIKRRGDGAAFILDSTDPLKKIIVCFGNDNSSEDITVSPEIFCRGVEDEISAEIEWPLQHWRPCIVANEN